MSKGSYLNIPGWMLDNMPKGQADIYSLIYNATHSERKCFDGSIKIIMETTKYSKMTVHRHLRDLESLGAIKRIGANAYKNIVYVALLNSNNIGEYQQRYQSNKMLPSRYQNVTNPSNKMLPYKKERKEIKQIKDISLLDKSNNSCVQPKIEGENEPMENKIVMYSGDSTRNDFYDGNNQIGWWRDYSYFYDEESDKLFIEYLDRIASGGNLEPKQVTAERLNIYNIAKTPIKEYTDDEINNMSEAELEALELQDAECGKIDYSKLMDVLNERIAI